MPRLCWAVAVMATASPALAQPQPTGGPAPPAFGQYLNLINRGGSPALNYYGIIRPQQQLAQQFNQLGQQQRQLAGQQQQLGQELQASEYGVYGQSVFGVNRLVRQTGFVPSFNNTGHYFSSNPALGQVGGGGRGGGFGTFSGAGAGLAGGQVGPRVPFAGAAGGAAGRGAGGGGRR